MAWMNRRPRTLWIRSPKQREKITIIVPISIEFRKKQLKAKIIYVKNVRNTLSHCMKLPTDARPATSITAKLVINRIRGELESMACILDLTEGIRKTNKATKKRAN